MPTLEEAMRMAESGKKMAADVRELHAEEEPEQLEMFEGLSVTEYRGSLAAGGFIKLDGSFEPDVRVKGTFEGYVKSVKFAKKKNKSTGRREHVIVIEADNTKITKA